MASGGRQKAGWFVCDPGEGQPGHRSTLRSTKRFLGGAEGCLSCKIFAVCLSDMSSLSAVLFCLSVSFYALYLLGRERRLSFPCARNGTDRFLPLTIERGWRSAEVSGSSGFLLLSKKGSDLWHVG